MLGNKDSKANRRVWEGTENADDYVWKAWKGNLVCTFVIYHIPIPCMCCDECVQRQEDAEGMWIHANPWADSRATTGYLLWYPECHQCHHPHHHLSGAGGSQMLREILHQPSDRSSVFSYVPVSWLCSPEQSSAEGTGFSHSLGCRRCGNKPPLEPHCIQLPLCSTGEEEPVLPFTQCAAAAVEKRHVANPSGLAGFSWHLCSSIWKQWGHVDLGASVGGWQGKLAPSGRWRAKSL